MTRVKTFDSTGLATAGRLYAGDLNSIQDQYADLVNYAQTHGVGLLAIGDASLQLLKYGAGELRLTGHVRTDGILRALGGMYAGAFTTAQRNAIPAGSRPYGLIIINTDTNRPEWNSGSDAVPNWQPIGITTIPPDSVTATELANGSVGQNELAANAVIASKVDGSLKPSISAAAATEALRALGTTGATAAAGNDARLSDQRVPTDGSVTNAKVAAGAGIEKSKLGALAIVDGDVSVGAAISEAKLALASDGAAGTPTRRTLGTGAQQAAAGNDARLSDQRTPLDNSVTQAKMADNSVGAAEIIDGSVGAAEIADGSVGDAELQHSYVRAIGDGVKLQAAQASGLTVAGGTSVAFSQVFSGTPYAVVITNSAPQAIVLQSKSASGFVFTWAGMGTGDGYTIDYIVIGPA